MKRQQICVHSSVLVLSSLLLGVENNSEELLVRVWHYGKFRILLVLKFSYLFCIFAGWNRSLTFHLKEYMTYHPTMNLDELHG